MSSSTFSFRKISGTVHLWLGLVTALFLTVICLTGTIFVFHTEIEKAIYPQYFRATPTDKPLTVDSLVNLVASKTKGNIISFRIPDVADEVWLFNIKEKDKSHKDKKSTPTPTKKARGKEVNPRDDKGKTYYVNPYSGNITYSGNTPAAGFFKEVEDIHRFFFLGKPAGKVITGLVSLFFVLIIFSGIIIWLPRKIKYWKDGFKIKFKAHWKRVNYDLHRALGIFVFPIVLLCALTGPSWSFEWYRIELGKVLGEEVFKQRKDKPVHIDTSNTLFTQNSRISLTKVIELGNRTYPNNAITLVTLPKDSTEAFTLSKIHSGFCLLNATDKISIDPYTGHILKKDIFSNKSIGSKIASLVRGIHVGEFYGTFSKTLYFIACLLATSLPLTGVFIWWNKRRKKPKFNKNMD